jgi:cyanophycin synthetase
LKLKKIIYKWIDKYFLGGCSSYNSLAVRKSCRSKLQARRMFADHDIPHARGTPFFNPLKAFSFAADHGFPLVVKPNISGFSRGSHFPIRSKGELLNAVFLARLWWPVSVVEQYLQGKNYRIVVVRKGIMSVIRRYPPFVDGDGLSTVSELIDEENAMREKMGLYPVIHPIPKDRRIKKYLRKKGMTLQSVPAQGVRVALFNRIALAPGGVVEIIDKTVLPEENRQLFESILEHFDANILGIDAIFREGIERSYREQQCILLEVNSRPYLKMHGFPRFGEPEDLSSYYSWLNSLEIAEQNIF